MKGHGMKKGSILLVAIIFVLSLSACIKEYDPDTAIRIEYETPRGCDEVSGIITLKASLKGDGAPVPAAVRYELRTAEEAEPVVVLGNAPSYEATFDTTSFRDGLVYYRAVPIDAAGNDINIQSLRYNPTAIIPKFRGIMVNNGGIDLTRPLIVFGAETEPYSGDLTGLWSAEQIQPHLTFAATLMEHLREVGNIPDLCFSDDTTIVMDPADPLAEHVLISDNLVDMLGEPVIGVPHWNKGTICLATPFFEIQKPNGIPDIWENTALDNIQAYTRYGSVKTEPEAFALYADISTLPAGDYHAVFEHQSYFEFRQPVRNAQPVNLVKEKLRSAITAGATGILIYDFYLKTNDFEMSVGSWPYYQKTVDELNQELGTSVRMGALTTNQAQLMHYDNFLRSLHLGLRDTMRTAHIPSDKKVGIILVEHGSSRTGRLYDVLRLSTKELNERLTSYITPRLGSLYNGNAALAISYIEGTYPPADGVLKLGEQVEDWMDEGYEYIVIYPVDWFWESRQTYQDLRELAVEKIDASNTDVYVRDERDRTEITLNNTHLIISETTLSKKSTCPAAVHYLKTAAAQLLEDRMIALTGAPAPDALSGTVAITGSEINLSLPLSDTLIVHDSKLLLQHAGIQGTCTITSDTVSGSLNTEDMAHYIFALLAENSIVVEQVTVHEARIDLSGAGIKFQGSLTAQAQATISGKKVSLTIHGVL